MAIASWPSNLPNLQGNVSGGGTDDLVPGLLVTSFDDGPSRQRRRMFHNRTPIKMSMDLTFAELVIFQAFVRDGINGGAARFTAPVLCPSGVVQTRVCQIEGGRVSVSYKDPLVPVVAFVLVVWDW